MFCPKCKEEYRVGFTTCAVCECDLVPELPKEEEPDLEITPCYLCDAADDFEAEVIIAKLRAEGIFSYKSYRGTDGYNRIFLGRTFLGVKIWVADKDLETAREIVEN